MAEVTVLALIKAKPGLEDTVKNELTALIEPTRKEPGCIGYSLHQNSEDQSRFMFYETWKSREDLDKHLAMPYLQALVAKADDLFDGPLDVSMWQVAD